MITDILHVTFVVSDLTHARDFYEHVLGLKINQQRPQMSFEGVWFDVTSNRQIHLMCLPNPEAGLVRPAHGGRDRHVALSVSDMDALVQKLNSAGVSYTFSQSGRKALFCRDPDQNALEFVSA